MNNNENQMNIKEYGKYLVLSGQVNIETLFDFKNKLLKKIEEFLDDSDGSYFDLKKYQLEDLLNYEWDIHFYDEKTKSSLQEVFDNLFDETLKNYAIINICGSRMEITVIDLRHYEKEKNEEKNYFK